MIPNNKVVQVSGSLPSEGRRMGMNEAGMPMIMKMLIDMYSDKELAVIRELSCNAWDSHIMAGNSQPIEVTTPSPLSPYMTIKDFGVGLSEDEVMVLFGEYGASTKRDSNEFTGMLGIGSKAPLTYTNQFTLTAIKDGQRIMVSISRDTDGVGRVTPVGAPTTTSEPNGVTIVIPAKGGNDFESKAKDFFQYWQPGQCLLNGKDPSGLGDAALKISDALYLLPSSGYYDRENVVVMGNVPYKTGNYQFGSVPHNHRAVLFVPIGTCEIAPDRESLADGDDTMETYRRLDRELGAGISAAIERDIQAAPTALLALRKILSHRNLIDNSVAYNWRGQTLPTYISTPVQPSDRYTLAARTLMVGTTRGHRSRSRAANQHSIGLERALGSLFITDFDGADVSPTMHRKAIQWMNKQREAGKLSNVNQYIVFLDWKPELLKHLDPAQIIDWPTIKAEKLPKEVSTSGGRIPGSFDIVLGGKSNRNTYGNAKAKTGVPGDDIDQSFPVYYFHGNTHTAAYDVIPILDDEHDSYTVICLPENRIAKFKRENPNIQQATDVIRAMAKKFADAMTDDQKRALGMREAYAFSTLQALKPYAAKFDDPAIQDALKLLSVDVKAIEAARQKFGGELFKSIKFVSPLDKYPLFATRHMAASIRYVNAEYAYQQDKAKLKAAA